MLVGHRLDRGDQGCCISIVLQQQARAGDRSERRGDLQLGIITPTGALPCIGPSVVEDIFALAMALGISGGDRSGMAVRPVDPDRDRLPASTRGGAARSFHDGQEGMA